MLTSTERQKLDHDFAEAEASFRIEGMDPSGDPCYEFAKAKVLAGEWTAREAVAYSVREASAPLLKAS